MVLVHGLRLMVHSSSQGSIETTINYVRLIYIMKYELTIFLLIVVSP